MFRLATPITSSRPVSEFDDITTIISHSSLTSSRKAAPWQQYVREDGHLLYVELTKTIQNPDTHKTDAGSSCSLCSTRSCHSCASQDTGYSSDNDTRSTLCTTPRSERSLLDLSHDSLSGQSRVGDFDDEVDDGVSVDFSDVVRIEDAWTKSDQHSDLRESRVQRTRYCHLCKTHRQSGRQKTVSCARSSSLCKRHSSKFSVPGSQFVSDSVTELSPTCKCGGGGGETTSRNTHQCRPTQKEVVLRVRPVEHAWDGRSKISWLESVLGIVPGRVDCFVAQCGSTKCDMRDRDTVVIKGLSPDAPALKTKDILAGDRLISLNGRQVTWDNLDMVLSSLHQTRKVRVKVERSSDVTLPAPNIATFTEQCLIHNTSDLIKFLVDNRHSTSSPQQRRRMRDEFGGVSVLYMSMEGIGADEKQEKKDVIYQFPREDSVLCRLRGCFFTLEHLLADADSSDVRMVSVDLDGSPIHIACRREGSDMLIVTAPESRIPSGQLLIVTNILVRLIRLLYGSEEQAFYGRQNHSQLDQFLLSVFTLMQPSLTPTPLDRLRPLHGYTSYLPLPDDVAISVGNILTEYESGDCLDTTNSFYDCRKMFTVLGSMVLYKGHVTCCHLSAEDAKDVSLYLGHSGVLDVSSMCCPNQLLMWREVFPTRLCSEVATINNVFGYSEPHARWFLMVVGVKNMILASVLEAGGYALQLKGVCQPDPVYVDQARAALVQLHNTDIVSACEIRLCGDGLPATTLADQFVPPAESKHQTVDSGHTKINSSIFGNPSMLPARGLDANGMWAHNKPPPFEFDDVGGSRIERLIKTNRNRDRQILPSLSSGCRNPGLIVDSDVNTYKLGSGRDNALLMFCQVNQQDGVIITSPVCDETVTDTSSLHKQVMENFNRCVRQIHADFVRAANVKVYPSDGVLEDFQGSMSLSCCREEGVMFTCQVADRTDNKKSACSLVYWVVGRRFRNLNCRELYVCFHESTPQNVVDLAFRLSLGSPLAP